MKKIKTTKIVFTGGGSGGHIYPIISIIRELKLISSDPTLEMFFAGPKNEIYRKLLKNEGLVVKSISSGKVRRYLKFNSFFQNFIDLAFKIPFGILQSIFFLIFNRPKLIFSKGGYGSVTIIFAAKILGIPVFLHESDSVVGMANKEIANSAAKVFTSFEKTEGLTNKNVVWVGNPLREGICNGNKETAKQLFNIKTDNPIVLILGGSLGSVRINNEIFEIAGKLLNNFELIHQTGNNNFENLKKELSVILSNEEQGKYHLYPFLNEEQLKNAYAIADIIIARAGSGTIFELAACGKPSILVPLPESAQNHQVKNAYLYSETGASLIIEETNFNSHYFLKLLTNLINDKEALEKLSQSALAFSKPDASKIIAKHINEYLLK
jgi:UDP-N-acetylglucosamine--N-acetylmuramyl-(pentapeptide) pyrophosphoryl-undecaprenol N-acetylglucosamine transferase